jgi:DNA invertase Pin-like site-specific DNA recombinase
MWAIVGSVIFTSCFFLESATNRLSQSQARKSHLPCIYHGVIFNRRALDLGDYAMPKPGRPHSGKWIAYYRVSTDRQGDSGLGLDAQRKLVNDYLNGGNWTLAADFTEVESGKRSDRPQLAAALAMCKRLRAKLIVANLSRLSRNVSFISALMDSGVEFVAADMPHANKMALQVLAVFAEYERDQISERTRRALAQAKERGVQLGGPKRLEASALGAAANKGNAERFAANTLPIIREIQASGVTTLRGVARALNARGVPSARGVPWSPVAVSNILKRSARPGGAE